MSPVVQFWLLIVVLALGTWLMRSLPIMLHGRVPHPAWLEGLLRHVPVAALAALIVPGALYVREAGAYSFAPARTIAAVLALLAAWRSKSVLVTLAVGMGALWLAQWGLTALG